MDVRGTEIGFVAISEQHIGEWEINLVVML